MKNFSNFWVKEEKAQVKCFRIHCWSRQNCMMPELVELSENSSFHWRCCSNCPSYISHTLLRELEYSKKRVKIKWIIELILFLWWCSVIRNPITIRWCRVLYVVDDHAQLSSWIFLYFLYSSFFFISSTHSLSLSLSCRFFPLQVGSHRARLLGEYKGNRYFCTNHCTINIKPTWLWVSFI